MIGYQAQLGIWWPRRILRLGMRRRADREKSDKRRQRLRFGSQIPRSRRAFFDHRGVLLRHLVHLAHRNIDLVDAGGLLLGSLCHFRNQGIDLDHLADDAPKGLSARIRRRLTYARIRRRLT